MWVLISHFNEYIPLQFQIIITLEHSCGTTVSTHESLFTNTHLFLKAPSGSRPEAPSSKMTHVSQS